MLSFSKVEKLRFEMSNDQIALLTLVSMICLVAGEEKKGDGSNQKFLNPK